VVALRAQQCRNLMTTLLLSQGVPMLLHGDELGRTQHGNNNAYCQDNELSWIAWDAADESLIDFTSRVIALRRAHPVFRRRRFFEGRPARVGDEVEDIAWWKPSGEPMSDEDWQSGTAKSVGVWLNGQGIRECDARGQRVTDDSFLLLFNAHDEALEFTLPPPEYGEAWRVDIDTASAGSHATEDEHRFGAKETLHVAARSCVVLCCAS
jgi:glycogen operon protein